MKSAATRILVFVIALALLPLSACSKRTTPNSSTPPKQSESRTSPATSDRSSQTDGGLTVDEAGEKLSTYLADHCGFAEGYDYLADGNKSTVFDTACFVFDWRNGPHKVGIEDRLAESYAISTDGNRIFHYDRGEDAWIEVDTESSPTMNDNGIRNIKAPTELIGNPDRMIMMINEAETVFDAGSPEYESIIEILNGRMPDGFAEAASAFLWMDEGTTQVDWSFMAQDFDYLRLCYDHTQTVKIKCMREGYEGYTPGLSFQDITFPLTESELSGSTEMCIIGSSAFLGVLDNSTEVLSTLLSM